MDTIDLNKIKRKSISGVFALTGRTALLQLISIAGYFFITIFLKTKEFGLFILVSAIIDILAYFSDIGLSAALIQKEKKPTLKEIQATFTIQQLLVLSGILLMFIFSPLIGNFYGLGREGMVLLYAFAFAFFCSSLKTIPSILLERKLEFSKIIIPQLVETILFYFTVVLLAWRGFGVTSYTAAVVVRAVSGAILIYILAPWKIGLSFSFKTLKQLLKFGIPYQGNTLIALVKDKFMILALGKIIGQEGIALIGWAEKWANIALRYFLDSVLKVAFPAFSRLQHDKLKLQRALEASLYFLSVMIFPAVAGFSLISSFLIKVVPRYSKWQPALVPLYLYSFNACLAVISTLLTNALTSIGKIKAVFKLMLLWTLLTWVFTPAMALKYGFIGVAWASVLVSLSSLAAIYVAKKYITFNLIPHLFPPLFSTLIMIFLLLIIKKILPFNIFGIIFLIVFGFFIYLGSMLLINKNKLLKEAKILLTYARP